MDWDFAGLMLLVCLMVLCAAFTEYRKNKLIHLERMAAIEKGLPPGSPNKRPLRVYLRRGLLWLIPGLGLVAFLEFVSGDFNNGWSIAGVLMSGIGLAYLLYYFAAKSERGVL
jgi:hypothetical protein